MASGFGVRCAPGRKVGHGGANHRTEAIRLPETSAAKDSFVPSLTSFLGHFPIGFGCLLLAVCTGRAVLPEVKTNLTY
jgi:hypothetical protein